MYINNLLIKRNNFFQCSCKRRYRCDVAVILRNVNLQCAFRFMFLYKVLPFSSGTLFLCCLLLFSLFLCLNSSFCINLFIDDMIIMITKRTALIFMWNIYIIWQNKPYFLHTYNRASIRSTRKNYLSNTWKYFPLNTIVNKILWNVDSKTMVITL